MRRMVIYLALLLMASVQATAQQVVQNKQRHFKKAVPAGNYSGVTWLGGDRYAVCNDKSATAGFHLMTIRLDSITGKIEDVRADSFLTSGLPNRDEEGICYVAPTNTLFLSGESDGQIVESALDGRLTGRKLNIPDVFGVSHGNKGFEALTYNAKTHRFWTTTENTLKSDGEQPSIKKKMANRLRLQSFGDKSTLGVSGLAALDDGQVIVLEREVRKKAKGIGSFVHVKLFVVNPQLQQPGDTLRKRLLTEFRTRINLLKRSFANYEGICAGPRLADGRQVLLLVADSQNQYKGYLKDWFKTIVISDISFNPNDYVTNPL